VQTQSSPDILVTGATGNVGYPILDHFPEPTRLRAALRAGDDKPLPAGVESVIFDFADTTTHAPALAGIRSMFLLRPPQITDVDGVFVPLLQAAERAGVQHVVFLSLLGVENNTVVPHYKIEQALMASPMNWTFLRASFFMQNLNTTHREEIRTQDEIIVPVGKGKTSFIDARDIGAVAALALQGDPIHHGQAYDLTGSAALTYWEVARIFSEELGRDIAYNDPSVFRFWRHMRAQGHPRMYVLVMEYLYFMTRRGLSAEVSPVAEMLLGRPPITFRQYVRDYKAAWERG
jgi:uncharacterized protein YbjT (DUF2867 family)